MSVRNSQLGLSPTQQDLLIAALPSDQAPAQKAQSKGSPLQSNHQRNGPQKISPSNKHQHGVFAASSQTVADPTRFDFGLDQSPYVDFDLDAEGDESFDFDVSGQMIGDISDSNGNGDIHEKRKSIDGKDDDDEGGGKRREGDNKSGKKPGRKPLTSEPTSKRKAQNRAAQRAFRDRKEKHLKDLETKVDDLEKSSESANHENGLLRAQVEKLQVELREYRKRLSWVSNNSLARSPPAKSASIENASRNSFGASGNDFQFEFPKFGDLPSNPIFSNGGTSRAPAQNAVRSSTLPASSSSPGAPGVGSRSSLSSSSAKNVVPSFNSSAHSPMKNPFTATPPAQSIQSSNKSSSSIDSLSGLFSPSIIEASRAGSFDYFPSTNTNNTNQSIRTSVDRTHPTAVPGLYSQSSASNTDSPASSSDSHQQASSIGTSPEPSLSSPSNKLSEIGLNTISEDIQAQNSFAGTAITPAFASNDISWLVQQNGSNFDPVLFGNYRESQDAVVSQDFGSYFNDAFPLPDLGSPAHNFNDFASTPAPAPAPAPKMDLMKQVDAAQNGDDEVAAGEGRVKLVTCNKIWDRLQSMEKFRNGEIDVDNLCSELRAKARCSEGGAVVDEKDVDKILGKAK